MENEQIKIDNIFKYQIQIEISGRIFFSDKVFDCKEEAEKYMSFLSNNKNCHWVSLPVLCPIENKSYKQIINEEFKK